MLSDCQWALRQHSGTSSGEPLRISWVAVVTLLRAVGHVLKFVDAKADADVREVVRGQFELWRKTKPKPEIFWRFIYCERNNVLKQYDFGFARTIEPPARTRTPVSSTPAGHAHALAFKFDALSVTGGPLPPQEIQIKSLFADGPFKGRSEKDVAAEAIRWWEDCLDEVEHLVLKRRTGHP